MYKKSVQGWLKHLDFMILDVVCLWISFTLTETWILSGICYDGQTNLSHHLMFRILFIYI